MHDCFVNMVQIEFSQIKLFDHVNYGIGGFAIAIYIMHHDEKSWKQIKLRSLN